ncbi:MAG: dehalogenase [Dehalobacter sp.]|nr:dehalogenase [Dehalobacter sp.]
MAGVIYSFFVGALSILIEIGVNSLTSVNGMILSWYGWVLIYFIYASIVMGISFVYINAVGKHKVATRRGAILLFAGSAAGVLVLLLFWHYCMYP